MVGRGAEMILGLNGLKGSGKDTVAAYLIKEHGFERRAFADPLKRSVAALFDIPFHEIDKYKNDPKVLVAVGEFVDLVGMDAPSSMFTFREFLQRYGTEAHRDVFGTDFWLDYTLPKDGFYAGRKIVLTDLRFDNEAMRVHNVNGFVIEIRRPDLDNEDQHSSEQPLPTNLVDYEIWNNFTLQVLYQRIEDMLHILGQRDVSSMVKEGP